MPSRAAVSARARVGEFIQIHQRITLKNYHILYAAQSLFVYAPASARRVAEARLAETCPWS